MKAIINGGNIPKGSVKVSGAKNSATRLLAAACLSDEEVILENFPTNLVDAKYKINFLENIGAKINVNEDIESLTINSNLLECKELQDYNYPIRTTYLLVASQIKKSGRAIIPYPGGCKIGNRGYDLHIMVWEQLGCKVYEKEEYILIEGEKFIGNTINFPISTVGGTENALMCASIADGKTEIINAYITPEIEDLIDFLVRLGAKIKVNGKSHISIEGVDYLKGTIKTVMYDRIEALTWLVYAAMTKGEILIENVPFNSMEVALIHIKESGIDYLQNKNSIYFSPICLNNNQIEPFEVSCGAHPGIISDMQPFYTLLGLQAKGRSLVFDYRYPERIGYVKELQKFYKEPALEAELGVITVHGLKETKPAEVNSTDLRGSIALVLTALCIEGESIVNNVEMALRGFNNLDKKLEALGISIKIIED